jgi:hypothetical protein
VLPCRCSVKDAGSVDVVTRVHCRESRMPRDRMKRLLNSARTVGKEQQADWLSRILSILALVITAVSVYVPYFRVSHRLIAVINTAAPDPGAPWIAVISNKGNQAETLLSAFLVADVQQDERSGYSLRFKSQVEPTVIKPGDQLIVRFEDTIEDVVTRAKGTLTSVPTLDIRVVMYAIGQEGVPIVSQTSVARVDFRSDRGESRYMSGKLISLLEAGDQ